METAKQIQECLLYIDRHLEESFTLSQIAGEMGYSEFHFSRWFRREMQISVMEYVKKRRLIKASEAILQGGNIIDTALRFGWQTHSGFTRAFKNEFGFYPALLKAVTMQIEYKGGREMSHVFLRDTEIHATKEQLLKLLKDVLAESGIYSDDGKIDTVYQQACRVYDGKIRYSGDEYITHPLNIAIILAEMGAGIATVYAGMFCDALSKTTVTAEELRKTLPAETVDIMEKVNSSGSCFGESADEEVILVKLAERLHNMRTVKFMDEAQRKEKAEETLEQIIPLAKRKELSRLLDELNDSSLKILRE